MKKTLLKTTTILTLCLPMLASCGGGLSSGDFEIKFTDSIPVAYVNQTYDFSNVIVKENGINYSLTANYYDFTSKSMKSLAVNGLTFVPVIKSDITVTVTANNATYIKNRKANLRVTAQGDAMDTLLSTGASNFADDGITKDLNLDEKYIKQGNSSIHAKYYGNNYYRWGAAVISPNNFRCLEQWTDKEWNNAILTFWVYNPTDYDFEFQLRVKEKSSEGGHVDIDWGDPKNTPQYAKPNQWTQIFFSMNKININHPLYVDESLTHNDQFIVKTWWHGTPGTAEAPETYSWQMYIDGVDVVDHTVYPDVDTTPFETIEQGWENMAKDTGWATATTCEYSNDACHKAGYDKSTKGLQLTFTKGNVPSDIGYAVVFSPEEEVNSGSISELPDFGKGSITADIKFSSDITDQTVDFFAVHKYTDQGVEKWDTRKVNTITLNDLGDGWKRLKFGLDKVDSLKDIGTTVRFGIKFNGVTSNNRNTAKVYVDNIFYDPNGNEPKPIYVRGEPFAPKKDANITFSTPVTVDSEAVINVDVKTSTTGKVSIALMDDWGTTGHGYFGYYDFETGEETYTGVTKTVLEDGYTRYAFKVKELDKAAVAEGAPKKIDHIYVRGQTTTATGYVDASVAK